MERRRCTTKSRRLRYSASMIGMESWGPRNASMAAFCAIDVGFEVVWLCSLSIASINGLGAKAKPTRQPVIAYVFESDPAITTFSLAPGMAAIENGSLSYKKRQ